MSTYNTRTNTFGHKRMNTCEYVVSAEVLPAGHVAAATAVATPGGRRGRRALPRPARATQQRNDAAPRSPAQVLTE